MNWLGFSRRRWLAISKFLGLACLCLVLTISCAGQPDSASSPDASASDRITIGTTLKPRTLDPADAYELSASTLLYSLGDRLYTYKPGTTELTPQLATELPTISEDGLTYTIPVREDVTFHDDTPFNAEAMAFSLQRFIENGGKPSSLLADVVDSVEATGDYELTIILKKPFAAFPALLTFAGTCAVSPQVYEIGTGKFQPSTFVGTGPYKLADFRTDSAQMDVFEEYWGEAPANEGIDFQFLTSPANLYNAIESGTVDIAYQSLDPQQINSLKQQGEAGNLQVIQAKGNVVSYLVLNLNQPPLDRVEVRRAIASLIDRPLIIERILQGQADPLYTLIPTTYEASKPVFEEAYGDGNMEQAAKLLEEAGYSAENPLELDIWYPSGSPIRAGVASTLRELAQQKLDGVLKLEPRTVEAATAFSNIDQGIYPTFLLDWYPDFADPDNYIHPFLSCTAGSAEEGCTEGSSAARGAFYYSDRANELISQERQQTDPAERQQTFEAIQDLLAEDVPFIPLWQNQDYAFAQNGVENVQLDPIQQLILTEISK